MRDIWDCLERWDLGDWCDAVIGFVCVSVLFWGVLWIVPLAHHVLQP
ncbi:hypothetical protein [Qingshengfaniella alkalisoli]|nr:hypothetical protein [Qingshengfaniella alkalisoli]